MLTDSDAQHPTLEDVDRRPPGLPTGPVDRPDRVIPRRWNVLLGLVVVIARFAFASEREIFHALPDEAGTLAMSRWLAGRPGWDMFESSTWQPGVSLIHAPLSRLFDDPILAYRSGLLLVAVVAGLGAVVLAGLIARLVEVGPLAAVVIAGAISLTPAGMSATSYLWAESLVTFWFLVTLRSMMRYFDRRSARDALLTVAAALAGYTSHGRLLPLVVLVVLVIGIDALRRRAPGHAIGVVGLATFGVLTIAAGSRVLFEQIWDDPGSENTPSTVLSHLSDPLAVADAVAGQLWYLLAATVGVFGLGLVALARQARADDVRGRDSRLVLATVATMMATSALFLAGRDTSSFAIYGRYNDAVILPVVAAGAVCLLRRRGWRAGNDGWAVMLAVLAVTLGLGLLVSALHGDSIAEGVTPPMVAGVAAFAASDSDIDVFRVGLAAAVIGLAFVGLASVRHRLREVGLLTMVLALLLVGAVRIRESTSLLLNSAVRAQTVVAVRELLEPGERVGVMFVPDDSSPKPTVTLFAQRRRIFAYQFFLVGQGFEAVDGPVATDEIRFIFAPLDDPDLVASGATPVWQDPVILMALWRESSSDESAEAP